MRVVAALGALLAIGSAAAAVAVPLAVKCNGESTAAGIGVISGTCDPTPSVTGWGALVVVALALLACSAVLAWSHRPHVVQLIGVVWILIFASAWVALLLVQPPSGLLVDLAVFGTVLHSGGVPGLPLTLPAGIVWLVGTAATQARPRHDGGWWS